MDLCEKHGDLTPTQKIKRHVVNLKYKELCDEMYTEDLKIDHKFLG